MKKKQESGLVHCFTNNQEKEFISAGLTSLTSLTCSVFHQINRRNEFELEIELE